MIKKIFFSGLILAGIINATAQQRVPMDQIVRVASYLSSDELNGRGTGTTEEKKAAKFIAEQFEAMHLKPKGRKGYFYDFSYKYDANIHDTIKANLKPKIGRNVMAFLDNGAEKTIVIGAHYDHCGLGLDGNSLDANPKGKIHNGRRGKIVSIRYGDIIVKTTDGKEPMMEGFHYTPQQLEKRVP